MVPITALDFSSPLLYNIRVMAKLKTGRHTSAIKSYFQSAKKEAHNRFIRKKVRLLAKNVELAVAGKKLDEAKKWLPECFSAWDKAVKIGVIHKNTASRKKSRLSSKIAALAHASAPA